MPRKRILNEQRERAARLGIALTQKKAEGGLSIQEIATQSGVGYQTVCALLAGKSAGPSFFLVADLAAALRVPLDTLAEESR